jgi:hypothetical protein
MRGKHEARFPLHYFAAEKEIEKEITLLHLFTTEEICSASPVVENVQLLSDLSLIGRKNKELIF